MSESIRLKVPKELPNMVLFAKSSYYWFNWKKHTLEVVKKIPVGIGILSNGTHSVKIK